MCRCVHVYMCMCRLMRMCMYIYICIYIYLIFLFPYLCVWSWLPHPVINCPFGHERLWAKTVAQEPPRASANTRGVWKLHSSLPGSITNVALSRLITGNLLESPRERTAIWPILIYREGQRSVLMGSALDSGQVAARPPQRPQRRCARTQRSVGSVGWKRRSWNQVFGKNISLICLGKGEWWS